MRKIKDLTGQQFGSLTVIERSPRKGKHTCTQWVCLCDCGNYLIVRADNLISGHSTKCSMCGCNNGRSMFVERGVEDRDGVV